MPSARVFGGACAIARAPARNVRNAAAWSSVAQPGIARKPIGCNERGRESVGALWPGATAGIAAPGASPAQTASVATSFQFGSRELASRAKVQASRIVCTSVASPSTTSPSLSRVRADQLGDEADRDARGAAVELRRRHLGLLDADEGQLRLLLPAPRARRSPRRSLHRHPARAGSSASARSPSAKAVTIIS